MSKPCVQWNIDCDTDTNATNCLNKINTDISAITSGWENDRNKNSNGKGVMKGKPFVAGIHRMSSETEKNMLINKIKGMGSPPFITGYVQYHLCSHDNDKPEPCIISERWEF